MRVLVTGPGGFVGRKLVPLLEARGHEVVPAGRAQIGDIGPETVWPLAGVDAVVHLAAQVHDPRAATAVFDRVNRMGTECLARAAESAGVRRFVFLSTAKVMGERSTRPLRETDPPRPEGAYAVSKHAAERALGSAIILRPPLVHGPGVRANFGALLTLARSGVPLPFANVRNRRSIIGVGNLADAILRCVEGPIERGLYHVRDGDFSTPELIATLRRAMHRKPRLFPFPQQVLRLVAPAPLVDSLQLDDTAFRRDFGWKPPIDPEVALRETAESTL